MDPVIEELMRADKPRIEIRVNGTALRLDPAGLATFANVFIKLARAGHLTPVPKRRRKSDG